MLGQPGPGRDPGVTRAVRITSHEVRVRGTHTTGCASQARAMYVICLGVKTWRALPVIFGTNVVSILLGGLSAGMVLFIVSVGLSVTMGLMGFVNLAHGAFAMLGGYVIVLAMNRANIGFFPALALGFVLTAAVSAVLERLLYRRLYRAAELDQVLVHHRPRVHLHRVDHAAHRPGESAAHPATCPAGTDRSGLHPVSDLQHLPDRDWHADRTRAVARLRAHPDRRPDPCYRRQPADGRIDRHQRRSPVHDHLCVRQRHGGARRRARRRVSRPRSAIRAQVSGLFPDRGGGGRDRAGDGRVLRVAA